MVEEDGELWMGSIVGIEPLASSSITINNLKVCFGAIAGGVTAGLYTLFIMAFNGLHIGAIATLVGKKRFGLSLLGICLSSRIFGTSRHIPLRWCGGC